jgi:hypothetical protein
MPTTRRGGRTRPRPSLVSRGAAWDSTISQIHASVWLSRGKRPLQRDRFAVVYAPRRVDGALRNADSSAARGRRGHQSRRYATRFGERFRWRFRAHELADATASSSFPCVVTPPAHPNNKRNQCRGNEDNDGRPRLNRPTWRSTRAFRAGLRIRLKQEH